MKFLRNLFRRDPVKVLDEIAAKPPEPDTDAIGELIVKQLRAAGMIPADASVKVSHVALGRNGAIKPPDDPPTEGWQWDAWSTEMQALAFPGWAPCRFAHKLAAPGRVAMARFVFGIVRGPFGIWRNRFDVCQHVAELGDWQRERTVLHCLTHLPSGVGMGIYDAVDAAALAADTAMRSVPDIESVGQWSTDEHSPWQKMAARMGEACKALGIQPSEDIHAHDVDTGSGPWPIIRLADPAAGKPEKLS